MKIEASQAKTAVVSVQIAKKRVRDQQAAHEEESIHRDVVICQKLHFRYTGELEFITQISFQS